MTETCDYLVKGAGAFAMAFVDTLLRETGATVLMVDRRHAPGGHWNDAYPFVRLHQPSACYGVASRKLGLDRIDSSGFNKGYYELASGIEVAGYFHAVMQETFLPSGRVRYYPMSEVSDGGEIKSLLSGERTAVTVKKKFVDATHLETSVPQTHTRAYSVADGFTCIPPNDLPRIAPQFGCFTVLGAGKTALDTVSWLLAGGAPADRIAWVLPRDPWVVNRKMFQPGEELFETGMTALADQYEISARAKTIREICEQMEEAGNWMRLDKAVWPTMFHAATLTDNEMSHLRQVERCIRKGRVRALERGRMVLDEGAVDVEPDTLFVDCTARGLSRNVNDTTPVFSRGRIDLQMIRIYQPTFSGALIAHMEATIADDGVKQAMSIPVPMTDVVEEWVRGQAASMINQAAWMKDEKLRAWIAGCRLDLLTTRVMKATMEQGPGLAAIQRLGAAGRPAVENLMRLGAAA
jgi:hypothetical protein